MISGDRAKAVSELVVTMPNCVTSLWRSIDRPAARLTLQIIV
jgi:hypothetical protein